MIDLGLSKLMLIGVVALVVVGPEKLPRVARTAGALLGRAQRYVNDIKTEVAQQMNVEELNEMKKTVEEAARGAEASLKKVESSIHKEVQDVEKTMSKSLEETKKDLDAAKQSVEETKKEVVKAWDAERAKKPFSAIESSIDPSVKKTETPSTVSAEIADQTHYSPKVPSTPPVQAHIPRDMPESQTVEEHKRGAAWRAKRAATPLWYKRRLRSRHVLRSDAARFLEKNN